MKITVLGRMNRKMRKLHDFMVNKVEWVTYRLFVCNWQFRPIQHWSDHRNFIGLPCAKEIGQNIFGCNGREFFQKVRLFVLRIEFKQLQIEIKIKEIFQK